MDKLAFADMAWDLLETLGGVIVIDQEGCLLYAGKPIAKFMGFDRDKAMGRPLSDFIPLTKLYDLLARAENEDFVAPENYFADGSSNIRRRFVVYRNGEKGRENVAGAASLDIFSSTQESKDGLNRMVGAIEKIFLRGGEDYREVFAGVYTADRHPDDILGVSSAVKGVKGLIAKVAPSSATVCILGETGTGKELVADAIHNLSKRADKPFVKINCAAIPKELMESELFGYEPGAFTGASRQGKIGKFEIAGGGTLLLDEIGELPLNLQAKLLRVLQSKEIERVGGTKSIPIDVRLICSTNRNLRRMVEEGTFRSDLYYRINTVEIEVPPLRERVEDIPLLVEHFIEEANRRNDLAITGISNGAARFLASLRWPGNIRELENAVERACVLCGEGGLDVRHFAFLMTGDRSAGSTGGEKKQLTTRRRFMIERQRTLDALEACDGNRTAAARLLGIARSTLYERLEKYGLQDI